MSEHTFALWLNFDSSIWTMTPGPPSIGIGCKISARHATSRQRRAIFTRVFLDAIPSDDIKLKEPLCDHFQRNWTWCWRDTLLASKNDPVRTVLDRLQWWHFLKEQNINGYTRKNEAVIFNIISLKLTGREKSTMLARAGGVLPCKRLMGICRWKGSHFHHWIDYHGVAFSFELLEWGCNFSDVWVRQFFICTISKRTRMFVQNVKIKVFFI